MKHETAYDSNDGCLPMFILFLVIITVISIAKFSESPKEIKSKELIIPTIEIILVNQVIDTLYIYSLKP
mgnify:CR=1 FL=1|tara:strand:- start:74209 stop:74415 length:207 start_codon:yes stop_codon:yes gene_type:complete